MPLVNPYVSFPAAGGDGPQFFVSTTGDNGDAGTEAEPWATLAFAVDQLVAGDTLIVEGGTYFESSITVTVSGTEEAPITIVAKSGETPIVDGSLAAFRAEGNSAWEVHAGNLYKSVSTFASPGDFGYTGHIDEAGTLYQLTSYADDPLAGLTSLSAVGDLFDPLDNYYMGPGITWNDADDKIYIRLDPNSAEAQWVGDPVGETPFEFVDVDPREHSIYLAPNNSGFTVSGDWVRIEGITLRHHWVGIEGAGADLTVTDCTIEPGRFGARVEGDRWTFDGVNIDHHLAPWIARSDVKSGAEPAKDTRTGGVSWESGGDHTFTGGSITGAFDAMLGLANTDGLTITHTVFDNSQDDALQLGSAAINVEIGYCTILGAGPSHDGSGDDASNTPDSVYVHHNVFDNTIPVFWARKPVEGVDPSENGEGGYLSPPCIGSHAVPSFDDPWKIYNNTFVAVETVGIQGVLHYMYHGSADGTGTHEAYNNLINLQTGDTRVYRNANANNGLEAYDYNIYARNSTPALGDFALDSIDETGTPQAIITSFANWQAAMGTFDANSIHQTTQVALNGSYEPAIGGPADGNGVDLSSTGWPGTTPGTDYIGAKAPV